MPRLPRPAIPAKYAPPRQNEFSQEIRATHRNTRVLAGDRLRVGRLNGFSFREGYCDLVEQLVDREVEVDAQRLYRLPPRNRLKLTNLYRTPGKLTFILRQG